MSDTSLVFALSARNDTGEGMRDARETVQDESEAMAADVEQSGATAGAGFGETLKAGVATAMVAVGAVVAAGFAEALDQSRLSSKLAAQLGVGPAEAAELSKVSASVYEDAWGDSVETVNMAIRGVYQNIGDTSQAEGGLEGLTTKALALAETFDQEVGPTTAAAGQLIKTGLAKDADEAFDIITAGMQRGANRADDFLDTLIGGADNLQTFGFTGEQATGLIVQGMEAGAESADSVIGLFEELVGNVSAGGDDLAQTFEDLHLDAAQMTTDLTSGGPAANKALDELLDSIRNLKDPIKQDAIVAALFGEEGAAMQNTLMAIDPSHAVQALGEVEGATEKVAKTMSESPAHAVESFKRGMQQNLVDFLGGTVIPGVIDFKAEFQDVFGSIWEEAGKGGATGADRIVNFFQTLGQRLVEKAVELAPKAVEALVSFGQKMADYAMSNPAQVFKIAVIAGALVMALVALPLLVATALGATAFLVMAGFVSKLVTGLVENVPQWWDAFTGWVSSKAGEAGETFTVLGLAIGTWFGGLWSRYISGPVGRQWDSWTGTVQALPGRAVTALSSLGSRLASSASGGWQRFKDASATKATEFIGWVGRLPGRTVAAVGNTGSLLYSKGRDVVTGLWNGISSLGGWLWDQVGDFVTDNVVGAATSFLDIGSPSKLMADAVGHWLPPGIAEGAEDNRGVLDDTMRSLVDPDLAMPAKPAAGTGVAPLAASAAGQTTVRIVVDGNDALTKVIRAIVVDVGGGNVQAAFGTP
ncbi:phage tail tape measure protein [Streptomyces sp. SP18BB07]|uniref:phage tail tape measure protein n=1 Tax=Streptomyces sp. SP18BB07 TaxID=3002522 RepID=UPI002E766ED2|nr:phage tail tape measure protein [Streptomyces sp. SP18BB07]MEE1763703.1 phage tail tape measure protein [Streptomyces sp. SP18BB07]